MCRLLGVSHFEERIANAFENNADIKKARVVVVAKVRANDRVCRKQFVMSELCVVP